MCGRGYVGVWVSVGVCEWVCLGVCVEGEGGWEGGGGVYNCSFATFATDGALVTLPPAWQTNRDNEHLKAVTTVFYHMYRSCDASTQGSNNNICKCHHVTGGFVLQTHNSLVHETCQGAGL